MPFEIKRAVRRALPLQLAFYGPEGSGKTMSALLLAFGLVSKSGKVVVIDTEVGRASLYADNKRILTAAPGGFDVLELDQPYHPNRFIEAIDACEQKGYEACLIDSSSDYWNGPGGCEDITEANGGMWNKAKLANKRLMTRINLSKMHVICCLKAQAKTKIIEGAVNPKTGKKVKEFVELGIMPICEKNFFYPMLLGFSVDPQTHLATVTKYHEDLLPLFKEPKLITKEDGEKLRLWNQGGAPVVDPHAALKARARIEAERGIDAYEKFFKNLATADRKILAVSTHAENKDIATGVSAEGVGVDDFVPEDDAREPATEPAPLGEAEMTVFEQQWLRLDKFKRLAQFASVKKELTKLVPGGAGEAEYYRILKNHGVPHSDQFGNPRDSFKAWVALNHVADDLKRLDAETVEA